MRISQFRDLTIFWIVAVLAVFCFSEASAQTIPSPYRFIDGSHSTGVVFGMARENRGALGIGPGGGPMLGGRYALELTGPIALEVTATLISTDRTIFDAVPGSGLVPLGDADTMVVAVDGRLRFTLTGGRTWHGFAPYLLLGGGLVGQLSGQSTLEAPLPITERFGFGPSFLGTMGGGLRFIPGDRLEFRAEPSLSIWKLGTPLSFFDIEEELGGALSDQEWVGVGALVVGVIYRL